MGGETRFEASFDVPVLAVPAQNDAGQQRPFFAQGAHQVHAGAIGQPEIAQQQVEVERRGELHGGGHIAGPAHLVAVDRQQPAHQPGGVGVVFHQQDAQGLHGAGEFGWRRRLFRRPPGHALQRGQRDDEGRPPVLSFAPGGDASIVQFHDGFADGQPQSKSPLAGVGFIPLLKRAERPGKEIGLHPHAAVTDFNGAGVPVAKGTHADGSPGRGEFDRVPEQV